MTRTCRSTRYRRARPAAGLAVILFVGCGDARSDPPQEVQTHDDVQQQPKVLVIGIDGVRPDVLRKVHTPYLDELVENGAFSDQAQTGLPTVSGPSWSSMLTGVWSNKHGVVDNTFEGKRYEEYPDFLTRIELVRPELHTFAVADWTPLVSEKGGGPLIGSAVDEVRVLDGYDLGWPEADAESVRLTVERMANGGLDALFVYLGNPDETSHTVGSIGIEYEEAIEAADRHVGRLIAGLRARPEYERERWLILVSTDHGRTVTGGHGGDTPDERTIFLIVSGPDALSGTIRGTPQIVDVAVTALTHLGIALDDEWGLDGRAVGLR